MELIYADVKWPVVPVPPASLALPTNTTMLLTGGHRDAHIENITTANLGGQKKK